MFPTLFKMVMNCSNAYSEEISLQLTHFPKMDKKLGSFTMLTALSKCFTVETARTFIHCTMKEIKRKQKQ
jgi:hypothetical protein